MKLPMVLCVSALLVAACGGDAGETGSSSTGAPAETSGEGGSDDGSDAEPGSVSDEGATTAGDRTAVITVDGETLNYSMDNVVFSNLEGIEDMTFETCSPDFFSSGRFYGIGYAVDDNGEVIVDADGNIAGQFVVNLPPDDWQENQRDAPEFDITLNDLSIRMATPEQAETLAPGEAMSWSIDDTSAKGSAVFSDFQNAYIVEFELICEGEPTITAGGGSQEPSEGSGGGDDGNGGFPLTGAGKGSFVADGESFDNVDVYSCEPFSFGSDPHPDDLSLLAYVGGSSGLEVEISHSEGFDQAGGTFDQVNVFVFYSRSGDSGLEQFERSAGNAADGYWYFGGGGFVTDESDRIDGAPFTINGDRITGELAGLEQTWPDEGAATVDVSFDLEIPSEVNSEC